ncbi:autophagy protein 16 [Stylonychia lemnae]|uniref:Autophagy protein 16 n=1 Tax=Stylonychia lemnae TaxID=5949 RepID=A0A078BDM8_STYLE|nr:autophagy protein 16 [Stylonychia lemnae]|eukprot:CDW91287.1 autophagy protein 16 [Stylonychia lemnae]
MHTFSHGYDWKLDQRDQDEHRTVKQYYSMINQQQKTIDDLRQKLSIYENYEYNINKKNFEETKLYKSMTEQIEKLNQGFTAMKDRCFQLEFELKLSKEEKQGLLEQIEEIEGLELKIEDLTDENQAKLELIENLRLIIDHNEDNKKEMLARYESLEQDKECLEAQIRIHEKKILELHSAEKSRKQTLLTSRNTIIKKQPLLQEKESQNGRQKNQEREQAEFVAKDSKFFNFTLQKMPKQTITQNKIEEEMLEDEDSSLRSKTFRHKNTTSRNGFNGFKGFVSVEEYDQEQDSPERKKTDYDFIQNGILDQMMGITDKLSKGQDSSRQKEQPTFPKTLKKQIQLPDKKVINICMDDEAQFIATQNENKISIWDTEDISLYRLINLGEAKIPTAMALSANKLLLFCTSDSQVQIINHDTRLVTLTHKNAHHGVITDCSFNKYNPRIVTVGVDKSMKIYDIQRNSNVQQIQMRTACTSYNVCKYDIVYFTGHTQGDLYLWSPDEVNGHLAHFQNYHNAEITSIQYIPDKNQLVTSSLDNTIHLMDLRTLKVISSFDNPSILKCNQKSKIKISPDGRYGCIINMEGSLLTLDLEKLGNDEGILDYKSIFQNDQDWSLVEVGFNKLLWGESEDVVILTDEIGQMRLYQ